MSTLRSLSLSSLLLVPFAGGLAAQQNEPLYDTPRVLFDGTHRFERTLDLNGDGFADAFGWYPVNSYYSQLRLRGYLNDGQGNLEATWSLTIHGDFDFFDSSASACGDFNGDGREDFAFGAADEVFVYRSNPGQQAPTQLLSQETGGLVSGMVAVDVTGDGWLDVVVLRGGFFSEPDQLEVYENLSGAGFAQLTSLPAVADAHDLLALDVDGNGTQDLVYNAGDTLWFQPVDAGNFGTPTSLVHGITSSPMLASGDVDGDGDQDIVVFGKPSYALLRRSGPASWSVEAPVLGGPATGLADIDGDGDLDGVCCGSGGPTSTFNRADSKFEIAINDGTGLFAPSFQMQGLGSHHLAGAVDLDHDGDLDLVAGRCVYESRGSLATSPQLDVGLPAQHVGLSALGVFDREGDGDPDYVSGAVTAHANTGDGRHVLEAPMISGTPPGFSYGGPGFPGDFDGDGVRDLVVSGWGQNFVSMRLLKGLGGGAYQDVGEAGNQGLDFNQGTCLFCDPMHPDEPFLARVVDFDGDGDLDIGTVAPLDYTPGGTEIFLNDGSGWFDYDKTIVGLVQGTGDFNADGVMDLWIAQSFYQGWMPGLGGGAYGAFQNAGIASSVVFSDVQAVADLDADGDLDVAAFDEDNVYQAHPILFWNDGQGGFTRESLGAIFEVEANTSYAEEPRRVHADDVNGDGLLDLIWSRVIFNSWPEGASTIAVQLRTAANDGWEEPQFYIADPDVLLDVDGDGDLDLAAGWVARNLRYEAPADGARTQYGSASPGSGGLHLTLGASGPFRLGESIELRLRGGVGGAPAWLLLGTAPSSLAGWPVADATLHVDLFGGSSWLFDLPLAGAPGALGAGGFDVGFQAGSNLLGVSWFHQAFAVDAGDPELITASNGLELVYGP